MASPTRLSVVRAIRSVMSTDAGVLLLEVVMALAVAVGVYGDDTVVMEHRQRRRQPACRR